VPDGSEDSVQKPPNKSPACSQEFETAWKQYPKRSGDNPKLKAWHAWCVRLKEGVRTTDMLDGVRRYAAWCDVSGKTGTEFIMQAATFFGKNSRYAETWVLPSVNGAGEQTPNFSDTPSPKELQRALNRRDHGDGASTTPSLQDVPGGGA